MDVFVAKSKEDWEKFYELLDEIPGVYTIMVDDYIAYIGEATDLLQIMRDHWKAIKENWWGHRWLNYMYVNGHQVSVNPFFICGDYTDKERYEKRHKMREELVKEFKPVLNYREYTKKNSKVIKVEYMPESLEEQKHLELDIDAIGHETDYSYEFMWLEGVMPY